MVEPDPRRLEGRARTSLEWIADEMAQAALAQILRRKCAVTIEVVGIARGNGVQAVLYVSPFSAWTLTPEEAAGLKAAVDRLGATGALPAPQTVAPHPAASAAREPTGLDADILDLLRRSGPLKGSAIARRLNREYSYVRRRLGVLGREGRLRNGDRGYELV